MSPPGTAREALLAEALGDLSQVLDRLDAIAPRIEAAGRTLGQASERLERQAQALDQQLTTLTERARVQAVRHIAGRTDELARQSLAQQTRAMEAAAQLVFRREVTKAVEQGDVYGKAAPRQQWLDPAPWTVALLSALLASACTWLTALWFLPQR